jgi:hypothetical protein
MRRENVMEGRGIIGEGMRWGRGKQMPPAAGGIIPPDP